MSYPQPPPAGTPGYSSQDLVNAINASTSDLLLRQSLLVGATGESNRDPLSVSSNYGQPNSGAGAFGFTPPYTVVEFAPKAAVAEMFSKYWTAERQLPPSLLGTGPAAAEWIAITAEGPAGVQPSNPAIQTPTAQQELTYIQQTGLPTYYGQNVSYQVGDWTTIQSLSGEKVKITGGGPPPTPPSAPNIGSRTTTGNTGPPIYPATIGETSDPSQLPPSNQPAAIAPVPPKPKNPNNPRGWIYQLDLAMNPQFEIQGTKKDNTHQNFWGGLEDLLTGQTELQVLGSVVGGVPVVGTVVHDAQILSNANNWWLVIREWITRIAVFIVGGILIFFAVNALTNGSLMNMLSNTPVPVPV